MRAFLLGLFCLVAVAEAAHEVTIKVIYCETSQCPDDCKPARNATADNTRYINDLRCHCACGSDKNEPCVTDDDCIFGLHCAAGNEIGGPGMCKDACQEPNACGIYDDCLIGPTSEKVCKCRKFECSGMNIGSGICAQDKSNGQRRTYINDCHFVNADCDLRREGGEGMERKAIHECGGVVDVERRAGVFNGFEFGKRF